MSKSIVLGALLFSSAALAQSLTEAQVVETVTRENPTVRASVADLQRTAETLRAEGARYRPRLLLDATATSQNAPNLNVAGGTTSQLNQALVFGAELAQTFSWGTQLSLRLENRGTRLQGPLYGGSTDQFILGPGYGFTARLSVTQPLLRGFGDDIGLAQLRTAMLDQKDQARARDETASSALSTALQAYWELWYAERSLAIERDARELARQQRDEAQRKVSFGTTAEVDLLSFETRVAELDQSVLDAEVLVRTRTVELHRAQGRTSTEAIDLSSVTAPELPTVDDTEALNAAEEASFSVTQARLAQERAETNFRSAADATRPRLDATAWLQTQGLGNGDAVAGLQQLGSFGNVSGNVGLVFELPLSGEQHEAQVGSARVAINAAKERVAAATVQVRADTTTELTTLAQARSRLALATRTVAVSERSADAQEKRQKNGAATALEVREAQESLRRARLAIERSRVDALKADVRLSHLTGRLLPKWGLASASSPTS